MRKAYMLSMRLATASFLLLLAVPALLAPSDRAYAVPAGQPCGGAPAAACDKGLWCEPMPGTCASSAGTCVAVPRLCVARRRSKSFHPVCGCNSKTYSSECFRRAYRVGKSKDGKC